jgi:hypothetical protein
VVVLVRGGVLAAFSLPDGLRGSVEVELRQLPGSVKPSAA